MEKKKKDNKHDTKKKKKIHQNKDLNTDYIDVSLQPWTGKILAQKVVG